MSQFLSSKVKISVANSTPYIDHWKFLHTKVQVMVPPSATYIVKALILVSLQRNMSATWLMMKLCVLPESTRINNGCFPTLPVTLKVFRPINPSNALRDMCGL
jgi:hypothetical protein